MLLLLLFSFIAGIVTILSPCILPILPIVLSGSLSGGRRRPVGIVLGFILSFTFFTLFLTTLVRLLGVPADSLRLFSVIIIGMFGISLLLPGFQSIVEKLFARLSLLMPNTSGKGGFLGGLLIGMSIGLLWTPCVGPILASVISLALTGSVTTTAFFITLAYSLGTAIPMFAIVMGGRKVLNKNTWLVKNTALIQKLFGVIMILMAIAIFFNYDRKIQTYILDKFPSYGIGLTQIEDAEIIKDELNDLNSSESEIEMGKPMDIGEYSKAPELIAGGEWFNAESMTLESLRGKVVLIDFWTYTCINCIRTLPYLKSWHEKYQDDGLEIIGVHTPEFEFEKEADNLQEAINDFELEYPIMQDNNYDTWRAYNNRYWPAKYLIDKEGNIRYTHFGEGAYDETEKMIQKLLIETGTSLDEKINNPKYSIETRTPEIYLGYGRLQYAVNSSQVVKDMQKMYEVSSPEPDKFGYEGYWTIGEEYAKPNEGSQLILNFNAKQVHLVMRTTDGQPSLAKLFLDGDEVFEYAGDDVQNSHVNIDTNRLYNLINLDDAGRHNLEIRFLDDNVEVYAFTFG